MDLAARGPLSQPLGDRASAVPFGCRKCFPLCEKIPAFSVQIILVRALPLIDRRPQHDRAVWVPDVFPEASRFERDRGQYTASAITTVAGDLHEQLT